MVWLTERQNGPMPRSTASPGFRKSTFGEPCASTDRDSAAAATPAQARSTVRRDIKTFIG